MHLRDIRMTRCGKNANTRSLDLPTDNASTITKSPSLAFVSNLGAPLYLEFLQSPTESEAGAVGHEVVTEQYFEGVSNDPLTTGIVLNYSPAH